MINNAVVVASRFEVRRWWMREKYVNDDRAWEEGEALTGRPVRGRPSKAEAFLPS